VNGVINIITKSARDTRGWLFSSAFGSEEQPSAGIRYAGQSRGDLHYRAYARYFDRAHFEDSTGRATGDDWRSVRGGFRLDWLPDAADELTVQGDIYSSDVGQYWTHASLTPPTNIDSEITRDHRGGNLLARWNHDYSPTSSSSLQVYYDRLRHLDTGSTETRDTGDIDWQHRFQLGARQNITWGLGYRISSDDIPPVPHYFYATSSKTTSLYSGFLQDEIALAADRLRLTLGTKLEHNDYTGFEVQPNVRALWTLGESKAVWASVARAVRMPARFDQNARVNAAILSEEEPALLLAFLNNPDIESEQVTAYELGYRSQVTSALAMDIAAFYNVYRDVLNFDEAEPFFEADPPPGHIVIPLVAQNSGDGDTYGVELAMQWAPTERWKLAASYSLLRMHIRPESVYLSSEDSPRNQLHLRSYLDLSRDLELNGAVYYVDQLSRLAIPSYVRVDIGMTWRAAPSMELGIWGQNLLDRRHGEFASLTTTIRTEIPRTVMGRVIWSF
jgi:iron complex outermembrane recepter protein